MLRIIIDVLIAVGAFFALAGTLGILKMPDTFCRMQASTCITTMGVIGVGLGGLLYAVFIMGSPAGAHAIAKGAYHAGIRPEKKMEIDDYRRDFDE